IDPGPQSALLTAALGLLLAGAAALGPYALVLPLIALQGLTAAGWFRLNGMWPARQGIALAFAGALVADGAVLAVDGTYGPGAIIGTLGVWVLLTLVLQLRSHADPDERMYGLMASVASAALAIACAGFLAADWAAVSAGAVA
ncbi:membrane protein, partial [Streptomyces sp. RSD-27]